MNILRQDTDYALRAMVNLAGKKPGERVTAKQISSEEGISYHFAAKILQKLCAARLVTSTMGPTGGFELARKADKITVLDVVQVVQGDVALNSCFLRNDPCPRCKGCMISRKTAGLQEHIVNSLNGITLADMVA